MARFFLPVTSRKTSAIDFGQFRLRPAFFSSSANSTSANFDFGQFRISDNFEFGQFDFGQLAEVEVSEVEYAEVEHHAKHTRNQQNTDMSIKRRAPNNASQSAPQKPFHLMQMGSSSISATMAPQPQQGSCHGAC